MKCSPTLVLQFSCCIKMQIYQQRIPPNIPLGNQTFHSCTSQMNSRHKSSKLNQSVQCFTISSYGFDFKCLIVSTQTQPILEMISRPRRPVEVEHQRSNRMIESSLLFSRIKLTHYPATS